MLHPLAVGELKFDCAAGQLAAPLFDHQILRRVRVSRQCATRDECLADRFALHSGFQEMPDSRNHIQVAFIGIYEALVRIVKHNAFGIAVHRFAETLSFVLGEFLLGNVAVHANHAQRPAIHGANRPADRANPKIFFIEPAIAVFQIKGHIVFQMIAKTLQHLYAVVRIQAQIPRKGIILEIEFLSKFLFTAAEKTLIFG